MSCFRFSPRPFGLGYAQVGVIRAVHGAAMWMLELPSGIISERFGERSLLAFGLLRERSRLSLGLRGGRV